MKKRPWLRGLAWLTFLGPLFFVTYNFANRYASRRTGVGALMFPWERQVPFLPWTVVPYWSSDVLYALSFATCRNAAEVDRHGKRLLAIQLFSIACFVAFPLRCTYERPAVAGVAGRLFAALETFDLPFNQAPSLHVSLAVILWSRYREVLRGPARGLAAAWFVLLAVSPMTTYQHHLIDIVTGAWAGLLVLAAVPDRRMAPAQVRLAMLYLGGAAVFTAAAFLTRGWGWLWLWPGFALSMVAAAYWSGDARWLGARWVLAPYTAAAWINSRVWTRGQAARNHLAGEVWIGRAPWGSVEDAAVVSLAPELHLRCDASVAMLDLAAPTCEQLEAAARAIERCAAEGPTMVCCALGYSRSALAAAAWLMASGRAESVAEAVEMVRRARPQVVLRADAVRRLEEWAEARRG